MNLGYEYHAIAGHPMLYFLVPVASNFNLGTMQISEMVANLRILNYCGVRYFEKLQLLLAFSVLCEIE
jgi:hypothetical protein